jgi:predicted RNA-binding protein with TRAM domain
MRMDLSERVHCLFTANVEERDGKYLIEVPESEVEAGELNARESYRVAMLPSSAKSEDGTRNRQGESKQRQPIRRQRDPQAQSSPSPPVEEGETRTVEIEDMGDQGDGIARVERGFVVIVPDTKQGERVRATITDVQENVAFAEVEERLSYYE